MTARTSPELFTLEEIHKRTREYCQTTKKTIFSVEDVVWTFPGREKVRRSEIGFGPWAMLKREISVFMQSDEMLQDWQLDSPTGGHSARRYKRRVDPIQESERIKPKTANRPRKDHHPLTRFHREQVSA